VVVGVSLGSKLGASDGFVDDHIDGIILCRVDGMLLGICDGTSFGSELGS
jgi:hypothetical protein